LELLALHEKYGEESNPHKKLEIFDKLSLMNEADFYKDKK